VISVVRQIKQIVVSTLIDWPPENSKCNQEEYLRICRRYPFVFFIKRKEKKRKEANQQVNEIMEHAC
jgi:hypothetical protein